jgi:uncharacterized protein (TIGR02145 family)
MKKLFILIPTFILLTLNGYNQNWWLEINADSTRGTFLDTRDNIIYKWVKIGDQVWMAENLKTTHFGNGDSITKVSDDNQWGIYLNEYSNAITYGFLYNWFAVADSRKICPTGFHIPDFTEWQKVIDFLGGKNRAGGKMKDTGLTNWTSPNAMATNESGFTAIPGGFRNEFGRYVLINNFALFWSGPEPNKSKVWQWDLYYNLGYILKYKASKLEGCSVRCVKN